MTANAFMSISLEPHLVMVSIAESARMREVMDESDGFAISILADDQRDVSAFFAGQHDALEPPPFREIEPGQAPVIEGAIAWLRCQMAQRHEVGDHVLYLGEAVDASAEDTAARRRPLVFLQTAYVPVVPEHAIPIDWAAEYLSFAALP